MSDSSNETDNEVVEYIGINYDSTTKIIDIGAGAGKMWDLLHKTHPNIDAIEVWTPNVEGYLRDKYNNIFNVNCLDFKDYKDYDIATIGDMLEHLTVEDAQKLLTMLPQDIVIVVPFSLHKTNLAGNPYQEHKQPDLTVENMEERYPELNLIWDNIKTSKTTPNGLGIYVRTKYV
jgi:hypothetical protein